MIGSLFCLILGYGLTKIGADEVIVNKYPRWREMMVITMMMMFIKWFEPVRFIH